MGAYNILLKVLYDDFLVMDTQLLGSILAASQQGQAV